MKLTVRRSAVDSSSRARASARSAHPDPDPDSRGYDGETRAVDEPLVDAVLSSELSMPIEDLDLSVRSYNCLKREGINTVSELVALSETQLMNIRNFGQKSVDEVQRQAHLDRPVAEGLGARVRRCALLRRLRRRRDQRLRPRAHDVF